MFLVAVAATIVVGRLGDRFGGPSPPHRPPRHRRIVHLRATGIQCPHHPIVQPAGPPQIRPPPPGPPQNRRPRLRRLPLRRRLLIVGAHSHTLLGGGDWRRAFQYCSGLKKAELNEGLKVVSQLHDDPPQRRKQQPPPSQSPPEQQRKRFYGIRHARRVPNGIQRLPPVRRLLQEGPRWPIPQRRERQRRHGRWIIERNKAPAAEAQRLWWQGYCE